MTVIIFGFTVTLKKIRKEKTGYICKFQDVLYSNGLVHWQVTPRIVPCLTDDQLSALGIITIGGRTILRQECQKQSPKGIYVTGSEKTDHFVIMEIVQYGPKALPRSRSRDFAISMPRCSTVS